VSVTAPAGFRAAAVAAGLKSTGEPDVAVVVNDGSSPTAAAVFTRNRVAAAPVVWSREVVAGRRVRAVVLNSGGANACTGPDGFADTHATAEMLAGALSAAGPIAVGAGEVVVCSTGIIGRRLDRERLLDGVARSVAALSADGGAAAAEAIRTTDTVAKQALVRGGGWSVGGMAKGAAMLAPGLATMLCVLTTDAVVDPVLADRVLRAAVRTTFERIDSDGCMSTNDTVLLLASGASGVAPAEDELAAAVTSAARNLTLALLADCEGAGKEVTVEVRGAKTEDDAVSVARALARNTLLKCALAGADPYWGRVLAAVGTTDATFDPDRLDVAFNGVRVCRDSQADPAAGPADISGRQVHLLLDLRSGAESATVWTTDLTPAYVHLNADYPT
jgi:glutamate N-acetyltransferase/amino-acid N-acetyltransferase